MSKLTFDERIADLDWQIVQALQRRSSLSHGKMTFSPSNIPQGFWDLRTALKHAQHELDDLRALRLIELNRPRH